MALPVAGQVHLEVLDAPALRDVDLCDPLYYWATAWRGLDREYRGTVLYESKDGTNFSEVARTAQQATIGYLDGDALADPPTTCPKWDNESVVDVFLLTPGASLSSKTEARVLQGENRAMIGAEVVGFRDVSFQGNNTYRLSGFLRGLRSTRDLAYNHVQGERFVLLEPTALQIRRYDRADVDVLRYFKAVPIGGDLADYTAEAVWLTARNMRPFPVHNVVGAYDGAYNLDLSWDRRPMGVKRLTRMVRQCSCCCVEDWYEIDLMSFADPTVVSKTYRNILDTTSYQIPNADMADAGYTFPGAVVTVRIYQISCAVGRGLVREESV